MARRCRPVKARTDLKDAVLVNNATYTDYLERFKKIAMNGCFTAKHSKLGGC